MLSRLSKLRLYRVSECSEICRATSGLHFLEVASVEALLAALADDSPQVAAWPCDTKSVESHTLAIRVVFSRPNRRVLHTQQQLAL